MKAPGTANKADEFAGRGNPGFWGVWAGSNGGGSEVRGQEHHPDYQRQGQVCLSMHKKYISIPADEGGLQDHSPDKRASNLLPLSSNIRRIFFMVHMFQKNTFSLLHGRNTVCCGQGKMADDQLPFSIAVAAPVAFQFAIQKRIKSFSSTFMPNDD